MEQRAPDQTTLPQGALNVLFPMHVILGTRGDIVQMGPTLRKVMGRDLCGVSFFEAFSIKKPRSIVDLTSLKAADGSKIVITGALPNGDRIEFRCLVTQMGETYDQMLIDFSFSSDFVDLVQSLNLSSKDFKPNDFSLDLIYTIETQRTLIEDSHRLTLALEHSKKEAEEAANIDVLTCIANRRALYTNLFNILSCPDKSANSFLFHIDLDEFKAINDSFGHSAGDYVLRHTASILREVAGENDLPARIGGDEFALLVSGLHSISDAVTLANGIRDRINSPLNFEGHVFKVGVSIGVVDLNEHPNDTPDQLFSCSDIALYEAKRTDESVVLLTSEMLDRHNEVSTLIKEISTGLEQDEFVPFFQPKVNTLNRQVSGIEVLARWRHPARGLVSPAAFIEVAESAKLMGAIEHAVMKKAIRSYKQWIDRDLKIGRLSFNLTAANLHSQNYVRTLLEELSNVGLSAENIELELLESVIFDRTDCVLRGRCMELKELGFHLALDDFGTGHSSISVLIDNPISTIKIDRSFISGIDNDVRLQRITRSILALSKQLELNIVAEGVETEEELSVLHAFGCYNVQGYLFSRPVDTTELDRWLSTWYDLMLPKEAIGLRQVD